MEGRSSVVFSYLRAGISWREEEFFEFVIANYKSFVPAVLMCIGSYFSPVLFQHCLSSRCLYGSRIFCFGRRRRKEGVRTTEEGRREEVHLTKDRRKEEHTVHFPESCKKA